ncbi:MAG: Uncharacterized protein Greene041662_942 [Candidatus Peregrinibacteria bacterium Greene0416_62]|nr:MAG: Uncharacterized protein Greene041662_942 [Candidatus Peregrinibacteria bacterium Greene0416_62]
MRRLMIPALLLFIPALALAADSLEYLLDDAERFEEELHRMETETSWDAEENTGMQSSELFPVSAEEEADQDEVRKEPEDGSMFVRIKVDGVPLDLSDVPKDSWFSPYVRAAAQAGIVTGYRDEKGMLRGLYGPADSVTIEQIAKIALVASGVDRSTCKITLLNVVGKGTWSEEYLRCAEHFHWAVFSDGSVDPLRPATRAEVVVTMLQAFGVEIHSTDAAPFTDVDSSTEFRSAILTAYDDHVVGGYSDSEGNATGKFGPTDSVNRAEVAKIVVLAKEIYGK